MKLITILLGAVAGAALVHQKNRRREQDQSMADQYARSGATTTYDLSDDEGMIRPDADAEPAP